MIKLDSCSLIYSIKIDIFDALKSLYSKIIISPTVKEEVIDSGKLKDFSDALIAEEKLNLGLIKIHSPKSMLQNIKLGKGETEILSLALEEQCPCLIDDIKAQKAGLNLKVDLKSTILILLELLKQKIITLTEYHSSLRKYGIIANLSHLELWFYEKLGDFLK